MGGNMEIDIGNRTLITVKGTNILAEVDPIANGCWVSLGHVGTQGMCIDSEEWDAFVRLVNMVDSHLENNYKICRLEME